MSASREKKQRQANEEPVVSSRAQEEREKAEKRRRNTIIYSLIGVVVVILIAALLIWDSGVFQRGAAVATINGEKVTGDQVAYYYYNNYIFSTAQTYTQYGITSTFSLEVSPKEQVITAAAAQEYGLDEGYVGMSYHDYFLDFALDSLRQEQVLCAAAKEAGYTLSAGGKAEVEAALEQIDTGREQYLSYYGANLSRSSYLQMIYGESMTYGRYRDCLERVELAEEYYTLGFDSLADFSDEELESFYQEHKELDTVRYYYRQFDGSAESTTDEEGNTVEPTAEEEAAALAAAEEEANAALAEVDGNLSAVEGNEDYNEEEGVLQPGSFYYDWLMDEAREPGDATILTGTTATSYYLVIFADRYRDETPTVNVRHILVEAEAEDDPATEDVDESLSTPTDEDYAQAKAEAEDLLAQWRAGAATEESFAALANEHSADPGSNTFGGLYTKVYEGQMIANFNDWIFDEGRQAGDVSEPIQNTQSSTKGWHLIYFAGHGEPVWKATARETLWSEELATGIEITRNDALEDIFP